MNQILKYFLFSDFLIKLTTLFFQISIHSGNPRTTPITPEKQFSFGIYIFCLFCEPLRQLFLSSLVSCWQNYKRIRIYFPIYFLKFNLKDCRFAGFTIASPKFFSWQKWKSLYSLHVPTVIGIRNRISFPQHLKSFETNIWIRFYCWIFEIIRNGRVI